MTASIFHRLARGVVQHIAEGRFDQLRFEPPANIEDFRLALSEYGRTFVPLPEHGLDEFDLYQGREGQPRWHLEFPLWTREEGKSDMWLYLIVRDEDEGKVAYVWDARVP